MRRLRRDDMVEIRTIMELIHYSKEPVILDRSRTYPQNSHSRLRGLGKPDGLWVSVLGQDDWKSWCEDQEFWLEGLTHPHQVMVTSENNILYITNEASLNKFHEEYSTESGMPAMGTFFKRQPDDFESQHRLIHWELVSSKFDGIVIAPYMWSMRYGPFWYYGWDCASGCIWNLDAIESMEML